MTPASKHDYANPNLPRLILEATQQWRSLQNTLVVIQYCTGILGLYTNINSDAGTPGVLERIQFMEEEGEASLESFRSFDEEEV